MSAALFPTQFFAVDAIVVDTFEALPTGDITSLPEVVGNGGAVLEETILDQR